MNINEKLKKIVPSMELRHKIVHLLTAKISDEKMLKFLYRLNTGKKLNLQNPKKFNEKIQWYKLNYRDDLMTLCSDKYAVRQYVEERGLGHIITPLYGVYEDARDIDFDELPDEFFLKLNHYSNGNILWRKTNNLNKDKVIKKLNRLLNINTYYLKREWAYKNIRPRIIAEELLVPEGSEPLVDFNFFCFNGEPQFFMYNTGLSDDTGRHSIGKRAVYDMELNRLKINTSMEDLRENEVHIPIDFKKMVEYSKILSEPFPMVRVDFFYINNEIRFGELTFYTGSGFTEYKPIEWEYKLGDLFQLPNKK